MYTVSQKTSPFLFLCVRFRPILLIFRRNIPQEIWNEHTHGPARISLYMFVLYLVKSSDASERTLRQPRRRPLPIRLVIEPESRNFFKSLFKPLTFQPLSENSQTNFLPPKTLNFYTFSFKMWNSTAPDLLHDLVWSASARHRQSNQPCGVDGCAPVWELMDETSNARIIWTLLGSYLMWQFDFCV